MQEEMDRVLDILDEKLSSCFGKFNFVVGKICGVKCVVVKCGVGKVSAAMCTQTMIIAYNPDYILNVGVAGGISTDVDIGDIVVATGVIQHDFDISAFSHRKKGEIPGTDCVVIKSTDWILNKFISISSEHGGNSVEPGIILSGDQFVNSSDKINSLRNEFGGVACDMESGSIGQVCYLNNKDFGIIRAISDKANEISNIDFRKFLETSSDNAAKMIKNFIESSQDLCWDKF